MFLDSSKTKEAINYCLNRWENLENFIKYPEATFSTNVAERSVKNWEKLLPWNIEITPYKIRGEWI